MEPIRRCKVCEKAIFWEPKGDASKNYCSLKCVRTALGEKGPREKRTYTRSPTVGKSIAINAAIIDLMLLGYQVYQACSDDNEADLLAAKGDEAKTIEVRCAYRSETGRVFCNRPPKKSRNPDLTYAMVINDRSVIYDPPLSGMGVFEVESEEKTEKEVQ